MYLSEEYKTFKSDVLRIWNESGFTKAEGRISFGVFVSFPNKRKCDISNRIKALEDSLKTLSFDDDEQIDELFIKRGPINKNDPHCVVIIRQIS